MAQITQQGIGARVPDLGYRHTTPGVIMRQQQHRGDSQSCFVLSDGRAKSHSLCKCELLERFPELLLEEKVLCSPWDISLPAWTSTSFYWAPHRQKLPAQPAAILLNLSLLRSQYQPGNLIGRGPSFQLLQATCLGQSQEDPFCLCACKTAAPAVGNAWPQPNRLSSRLGAR